MWLICVDAGDRSYRTGSDTEGAATTDNPTTPFPTPPPTLTPNHRQASPFPLESTNSRRHHYNGSISSERSRNGNGRELIRAANVGFACTQDDTYAGSRGKMNLIKRNFILRCTTVARARRAHWEIAAYGRFKMINYAALHVRWLQFYTRSISIKYFSRLIVYHRYAARFR